MLNTLWLLHILKPLAPPLPFKSIKIPNSLEHDDMTQEYRNSVLTTKYCAHTGHSCGLPFSSQNQTTSCSSSVKVENDREN